MDGTGGKSIFGGKCTFMTNAISVPIYLLRVRRTPFSTVLATLTMIHCSVLLWSRSCWRRIQVHTFDRGFTEYGQRRPRHKWYVICRFQAHLQTRVKSQWLHIIYWLEHNQTFSFFFQTGSQFFITFGTFSTLISSAQLWTMLFQVLWIFACIMCTFKKLLTSNWFFFYCFWIE